MATLKDWLQLTRAHTAPLEMLIALMGASFGAGGLLRIEVLHFTLLGFLYHLAGYGQNSLEDFLKGYDTTDPHKTHHPLQRGAISPGEARRGIKILFVVTLIYALYLTRLKAPSLLLLAVVVGTGLLYNLRGKSLHFKFLPIAVAHSTLLPFAYFSSGGEPSGEASFILLWAYIYLLLQITYQILIEGDIKDMDVREASLLKRMGTEVRDGVLYVPRGVYALGTALKLSSVFIIVLLWYLLDLSTYAFVLLLILIGSMLYFHHRLLRGGPFNHSRVLKDMALEEVTSTFLLLSVFSPLYHPEVGYLLAILLMVLSILYFSVMNRLLWGTALTPKV